MCATRCFVKTLGCWWCLDLNMDIVFITWLFVWDWVWAYFIESLLVSAVHYPSINLLFVLEKAPQWLYFYWNQTFALGYFPSDSYKRVHVIFLKYGKVKKPLPAFLYVLAELKMHLLPVANCERRAFDIMRGLEQNRVHVQACCHYSSCYMLWAYFYCFTADALLVWERILIYSVLLNCGMVNLHQWWGANTVFLLVF